MEIELGLKITHTRDDATSSTEFWFAKDHTGPLFFSRETATMFILIAYLRGFKRENIKIKISEDGKKLTIGGKRLVQEITLRGWIMHKTDVEIRELRKVFLIPDGVNLNRIKAKFNNEESTLRITMPKFVKGICGIEIQEVTEEHKERPETARPVDDLAHEIEQREPKIQRAEDTDQVEHKEYRCEPEISEGIDQSLLKDRESLEEGVEPRIEREEKIDNVEEKAVDALQFGKDSQVEQGGVSGCEPMTPAVGDKSLQKDGTPMEEVEAPMMKKKEETDHVVDQAFDAFQGDKQNHLEQDEFQDDKQEQVEQAFDEFQSDKQDQMDQRDVNKGEPEAPPVIIDETSQKGGKSLEEDAESVMESKMDEMVEPQHDEADQVQQREISRRELEIPQAMIDETTQKEVNSLEKDVESMMQGKVDQLVEKPQHDKADEVQPSQVSRYEPELSEGLVDQSSLKAGESLEEGAESRIEQKDGKSPEEEEGAESMVKSKEKIDQVAEKAVEHGKAEFVDEVFPEMESRKLIPEKKSKEPKNKESKKAVEEKLIEAKLKDMQAVASTQLEEATSEKKEPPASFPETTSRESLETHRPGQEQVTNLEPEVALDTVDEALKKDKEFPEETTKKKLEKEEISEAVMQESQLKEMEMPEVLPELDNNKIIPKEKPKKQKTEEKERGPEMAVEEKPDQEPMEMQNANEMVPRTIVSSQVGEATPEKAESPSTTYPEIPAPEIEPLKTDHEVKKTVDDAAPRKDETFEESEKAKIKRHGVHDSNELQLNELERTADVSPEMGASKLVSEETYEKPKTEVKEETEGAGEENHDQVDLKEMEDMTELVPQNVVPKELEDFTHKKGYPEITMELHKEKEVIKWEPEVARSAVDDEPKKDEEVVEEAARSKISSEKEVQAAEISPEPDAKELMQRREPEKQKLETRKVTEKAAEEKLDGGESREVPQITKFMHLEEAIPKKKEPATASIAVPEIALKSVPSETYPSGEKDVSKCETETAKVAFSEATRRDEQSLKETAEPKFDGSEGTDKAMQVGVDEWQPSEVEEIAQISPKDEIKLIPGVKYEKPEDVRKDEPEKLVEEKLHEREFKEMEEPAQLVPQSTVSMQVVKISPEGDKHPVSSASYPETAIPHVETPKTQHVEKKDVTKWEPEVKKVLYDEQPEKDKESVDETKTKDKEDVDQVEHQRQLMGTDRAAKIPGEMDGSRLVIEEELEKPKLGMKEETEKDVEEKLDEEGPTRVDMMPETIASLQLEEDIPNKTELPSTSALHPKMTSDSDTSEFQYDGEKEATQQQAEAAKSVVEEVPKKEEDTIQEIAKPKIKIEEESDQAMQHVVEEVPNKEGMLQEIAKPKIKFEEESDKAIQHVTDGSSVSEFEGATAVSPGMDHRKLLSEESLGKPQLEIKEETGKTEEKVDNGESKAMEEATGAVPEIITGVMQVEQEGLAIEAGADASLTMESKETTPEGEDFEEPKGSHFEEKKVHEQELELVKFPAGDSLKKDEELADKDTKLETKSKDEIDQVKEMVKVSPETDISKLASEKIDEEPKMKMKEETGKLADENVDEEKGSLEEAEKLKLDGEEEPDHVVGQVADELSFGVEEVPEVSPSMDSSKMVPEEKFERQDIGIKEDMQKAMKEKVEGGGESRELQVLTQLVPETPAEEEPPFRKIAENFGGKPEKKIEEPQMKEPRADQKSQTEELLDLEEHEMQVKLAERSLLEEEVKLPKGVDLADVTDQVAQQPEEPNVIETQADQAHIASKPMKDLKLPESEKQEHETSVGIIRPQPEKGKEQVEAPVLTGEPRKDFSCGHDEDHGVADEYTSEKQEAIIELPMKPDKGKEQIETRRIAQLQEDGDYQQDEDNGIKAEKLPPGTSVQGPVKPETDQEKEQVETPILPYEPPQDDDHAQDKDHRKRKETPPEKWKLGLSFEGLMKPLPDQERKHVETPLLADEQKSIRDHILDEDHGLEKEIESEKKKPEISFEEPMKHKPDQEKEQVETLVLADELPRDGDHGQESETTPEKREPGMSFEGQMKPVPGKERVQVETSLLGDEPQKDRGRGQEKEIEFEKKEAELSIEGRMTPEPDQKIQQVETPVLADEAKKNGDRKEDEVHGLQSEIESGKIELQVILEGPIKPETAKEKGQVETPLLADKEEKGDGHVKAVVHELGKEIELNDEVKLPEKKEIEEHEQPETEIQKDFRIEQTTRKMDTVPIKWSERLGS